MNDFDKIQQIYIVLVVNKFLDDIFDEIFNLILWEHVRIVNFDNLVVKYCFDDGKILVYYDL